MLKSNPRLYCGGHQTYILQFAWSSSYFYCTLSWSRFFSDAIIRRVDSPRLSV